jgi:Mn-dependent DtxR family transcriptional regulator
MDIHESGEDYLEQILKLLEKKGHARSIDIAAGLNVSKPSVSVAMKKLRENGYITMGTDNNISLTDKGYAIARRIYDRHRTLTRFLVQLGVPPEIAEEDACLMEHDISEETYQAFRKSMIEEDAGK